jgi:hypothetical protein
MEGGVKYWTDYLKVYLAPQSLCLLPGLWQVYSTLHTLSSSLLRFTFVCAVGERSSANLQLDGLDNFGGRAQRTSPALGMGTGS